VRWTKKPWGRYKVIWDDRGMKVKILEVNPGDRMSLQLHRKRAETWYLLQGIGKFFLKDKQVLVKNMVGWHAVIGMNTLHRIHNVGEEVLTILEIQEGECLETDIERFEDDYGRTKKIADTRIKRTNNKV
jgi:mannose-6-phosphate isomerase-like protein (cupin superfamily)